MSRDIIQLEDILSIIRDKLPSQQLITEAFTRMKNYIKITDISLKKKANIQQIFGMKIFQTPSYKKSIANQSIGPFFNIYRIYEDMLNTVEDGASIEKLKDIDYLISPNESFTPTSFTDKYVQFGETTQLTYGQTINMILKDLIEQLDLIRVFRYNIYLFSQYFGGVIYTQTQCAGTKYFRDRDYDNSAQLYAAIGITPYAEDINVSEARNGLFLLNSNLVQIKQAQKNKQLGELIMLNNNMTDVVEDKFQLNDFSGTNGVLTQFVKIQNTQRNLAEVLDLNQYYDFSNKTKITKRDVEEAIEYIFSTWKTNLGSMNYNMFICHYNCHGNSVNQPPDFEFASHTVKLVIQYSSPPEKYRETYDINHNGYIYKSGTTTVISQFVVDKDHQTLIVDVNYPTLKQPAATKESGIEFGAKFACIGGKDNFEILTYQQKYSGTGVAQTLTPTKQKVSIKFADLQAHVFDDEDPENETVYVTFSMVRVHDKKISYVVDSKKTTGINPTNYWPTFEKQTLQTDTVPTKAGWVFSRWISHTPPNALDITQSTSDGVFVLNENINIDLSVQVEWGDNNKHVTYDYSDLDALVEDERIAFTYSPAVNIEYYAPEIGKVYTARFNYPTGVTKITPTKDFWNSNAWRIQCEVWDKDQTTNLSTFVQTNNATPKYVDFKTIPGGQDLYVKFTIVGTVRQITYDYQKLEALKTLLETEYSDTLTYDVVDTNPKYYQSYRTIDTTQVALTSFYPVCQTKEGWNAKGWRLKQTIYDIGSQGVLTSNAQTAVNTAKSLAYKDTKYSGGQDLSVVFDIEGKFHPIVYDYSEIDTVIQKIKRIDEKVYEYVKSESNPKYYQGYELTSSSVNTLTGYYPTGSFANDWLLKMTIVDQHSQAQLTSVIQAKKNTLTATYKEAAKTGGNDLSVKFSIAGKFKTISHDYSQLDALSSYIYDTYNESKLDYDVGTYTACYYQDSETTATTLKFGHPHYEKLDNWSIDDTTGATSWKSSLSVYSVTPEPYLAEEGTQIASTFLTSYILTAAWAKTQTAVSYTIAKNSGKDLCVCYGIAGNFNEIRYSAPQISGPDGFNLELADQDQTMYYQHLSSANTTLTVHYPAVDITSGVALSCLVYDMTGSKAESPTYLTSLSQTKNNSPLTATYSIAKTLNSYRGADLSVVFMLSEKYTTPAITYYNEGTSTKQTLTPSTYVPKLSDQTFKLNKIPTLTGKTFAYLQGDAIKGYNDLKDDGSRYVDAIDKFFVPAKTVGPLTIFCVFTDTLYNITYQNLPEGSDNSMNATTAIYNQTIVFSDPILPEGYTFKMWTTSSTSTTKVTSAKITKDYSLYCKYATS